MDHFILARVDWTISFWLELFRFPPFLRRPWRKEVGGKEAPETMTFLLVLDIYEKSRSFILIPTCVLKQCRGDRVNSKLMKISNI